MACCAIACEQAPGGASTEQTFGAKRRARRACTHSPKSPMPSTRRLSCKLSNFNQSAHAGSKNPKPKQPNNDSRESLVQAPCFTEKLQKSYVWLKSRHTKARTITVDVASCLNHFVDTRRTFAQRLLLQEPVRRLAVRELIDLTRNQ